MTAFTLRPATPDDIPNIADLLNARDAEFFGTQSNTLESVGGSLNGKEFDLSGSVCAAVTPDGALVGFAALFDNTDAARANLWGSVHPAWRGNGIGSALMAWIDDRAARNLNRVPEGERVSVITQAFAEDTAAKPLLSASGFAFRRSFYTMRRDFDAAPEMIALPDGFRLMTYNEIPDLDAFLAVRNESFLDHWNEMEPALPVQAAHWRNHVDTSPDFDPSLWWLAYHGDEPAAVIICGNRSPLGENIAWVAEMGVLRPYRKQGLAAALLSTAFITLHGRGKTGIALGVDASSPTNAVAVYKRAGMRVYRQRDFYEKTLRE